MSAFVYENYAAKITIYFFTTKFSSVKTRIFYLVT